MKWLKIASKTEQKLRANNIEYNEITLIKDTYSLYKIPKLFGNTDAQSRLIHRIKPRHFVISAFYSTHMGSCIRNTFIILCPSLCHFRTLHVLTSVHFIFVWWVYFHQIHLIFLLFFFSSSLHFSLNI